MAFHRLPEFSWNGLKDSRFSMREEQIGKIL